MNSINKNQPEQNHENLVNGKAIEKIRELVKKANTCFFCTAAATGPSGAARPMSVQKTDDKGQLWFLSAVDSHTIKEITNDPSVHLYFQGSAHSDFMHLSGKASVSQNAAVIKELWEPVLKTWFTEGENDPRIRVICVTPSEGYYWDNKHGNFIAGIKIMIGALSGQTLDDSIEGTIKP